MTRMESGLNFEEEHTSVIRAYGADFFAEVYFRIECKNSISCFSISREGIVCFGVTRIAKA